MGKNAIKKNGLLLGIFILMCINVFSQRLFTRSPEDIVRLKNDKNKVIKEADKILSSYVVLSVANKKLLEVSNDKNDYVSMATYWWPNPKKADGLPYIRRDGKTNPEINKLYSDYKNLENFSSRIMALGDAYYLSRNQKYIKESEKYLRTWFIDKTTRMNPNLNHSQFIKGINKGRIEGIIDTKLLINVIEGIDLLNSDGKMDAELILEVKNWFKSFLNWMETSPTGKKGFSLKNNIATSYHLQRMVYYTFIGNDTKAMDIYYSDVNKLFNNQIDKEGKQALELLRTDASGYSKANLIYLNQCVNLVQNLRGDDVRTLKSSKKKLESARKYIIDRK